MNEQLESLRLLIIQAEDNLKDRKKLFELHYPKLQTLAASVAEIHPSEKRRTILLARFNALVPLRFNLMPFADVLCEIYQKTNNNNVRRLIDVYQGGWTP